MLEPLDEARKHITARGEQFSPTGPKCIRPYGTLSVISHEILPAFCKACVPPLQGNPVLVLPILNKRASIFSRGEETLPLKDHHLMTADRTADFNADLGTKQVPPQVYTELTRKQHLFASMIQPLHRKCPNWLSPTGCQATVDRS